MNLAIMRNLQRWLFVLLTIVSFILLYVLFQQMGSGTLWALRQSMYLFPEIQQPDDLGDDLFHENFHHHDHHEEAGNAGNAGNQKSHNHNLQVGFILHESALGAPEFVGRNQKDVSYFGNDPNTFLNVAMDGIRSSFNEQDYPENNIAIGCGITTRQEVDLNEENIALHLPFFKGLLSSFCTTATRGFKYHFYVAHDHTDPFFQSPNAHKIFNEVFYEQLLRRCSRRLNATLHLVECQHTGNPAWAQNDAMMAAYMDNIDYYYRVNDDTVMETTGWTEKFIDELQRYNPPNLGVVGPWFKEGNVVILTHDFVHRTHIDIFGFYYPRVFTDWFADNWITSVYWPERCRKVPGTRVKHTMEKGQRYVAHYEKASRVKVETEIGKVIIKRYIDRKERGAFDIAWSKNSTGVISMSLHGDDIGTLYGSLRYSQLIPILYPKWRLRVYVGLNSSSPRVLKILVTKLENTGIEIIYLGNKTVSRLAPSLWRYLVADDMSVERFIVRDANTRPSERELAALEDWLQHDSAFYCIRDHPSHAIKSLYPGLVGGMPALLRKITGTTFRKLMKGFRSEDKFLQEAIWPKVEKHALCHDSVSCKSCQGSLPFPILRSESEFVGQHYDSNDQLVDIDDVFFWNRTYVQPECVFVKNTGFEEEAVRAVIKSQPILWSQDYHVTPVMDIKSLLSPIGVKVLDNSLSYYCGKIGTCAKNLKVINSENGMGLGPELIRKFYHVYKDDPVMKSVTAFVCTLPVAMCEAFVPFNKSIIIIAAIRYEQARAEPEKWHELNKLLLHVSKHKSSVLAANNLYDAKYIEYFTGLKTLVIPNYCAYLPDTYKPTRKQFLVSPIHSTDLYEIFFAEFDNIVIRKNLNLVMFPMREMYPQYLYSDLASHRGIIYIPYQVSMISLTEQYRMNIPLFFPTLDLLTKWHIKYQVVRQRTWKGYMMKQSFKSAILGLYPKVPDPNNDMDEDAVRYWLKFADFYQWPHIIYFDSVDDLVEKMMTVDLNEISRRMAVFNNKTRLSIKDSWSQVLLKITRDL